MRYLLSLAVFLAFLSASTGCQGQSETHETRILFLGNSLTYVGNLPSLLENLGAAQGENIEAVFIGDGGVTLANLAVNTEVRSAISSGRFDFVVLQERGGDLICTFGPNSCEQSREAHASLIELTREANAVPILLGTYQFLEQASKAITDAEIRLSESFETQHVAVSSMLQAAQAKHPNLEWLAPDGAHPGKFLQLIVSIALYRELFGELETDRAEGFAICASALTTCDLSLDAGSHPGSDSADADGTVTYTHNEVLLGSDIAR